MIMKPPTPPPAVHDAARLDALARYDILDTPAEPGFDGIVQLACQLCNAPVALVSLVAEDRQWFKARVGFPSCETDLNSSVCAHALAQPDDLLIIPDLTTDPRTMANPLVTGEPFIRFYAGAPLRTASGLVLGSLCVIDKAPRPEGLTASQASSLRLLAEQVMNQLELRRAVTARDTLRAAEVQAFRAREAFRDTQVAVVAAGDDITTVLRAVVDGAMQAVPAADGGVVELLDGGELEYRVVRGSLLSHQGVRVPLNGSGSGHCVQTRAPYLMMDVASDPFVKHDLAERLGQRSAIFAPILRGNTVLGVLKLQAAFPFAFSEPDLAQIGLFAGAVTAGLAEADARAETREQDAYWRKLFDRLGEGFQLSEVIRNDDGQISDFRVVEINPAWSAQVGIPADQVIGRSASTLFGEAAAEWMAAFSQVVETRQPWAFTKQFNPNGRWYDGRAFPLDGDRFGVIFLDVTARVDAESRRMALLALGDSLRDLTTISEMTFVAAEIVGRTLGATRAGFGQIEGDVEAVVIERDWTAAGQVSIAGRHVFENYGDLRGNLRRGEALVIDDVSTDPRTSADPSAVRAIGIGSLVNMPVRDKGHTVAVFIVHDVNPRIWTPEELAFLRNVADRIEVGVARVRAEEMQAVLNHELAHRLKNTLAIVQSIASSTLRGVTERAPVEAFERRVLALSRAHDVLMQKSWTAARMRAVMESVLVIQADLDRFALDGPDLDISPQAALSLSLLLHELATNALKYGSLSADAGKVRIAWRTEGAQAPTFVLDWTESGGPAITPPANRGGFGSKLIRMGLVGTRVASIRYDTVGLQAEFRAPLAEFQVQVH